MSDSKGDKLRSKGHNWKERGYPAWKDYIERAANWYEEHGEFNRAGWCWDEIENFQKAFSCYKKGGNSEKAVNSLNALTDKCDKEGKYKEAMECRILTLIYSRSHPSLLTVISVGIKQLPKETAKDLVKQNWGEIAPLIESGCEDEFYRDICRRNPNDLYLKNNADVVTLFDGDDFIDKLVLSLTIGLYHYAGKNDYYDNHCDISPIYFCKFIRQRCNHFDLAIKVCEMAIKDRVRAKEDICIWDLNEWLWLKELSMAYIDAGDSKKVLDTFLSRHWYSEAAGIFEILGRFEEAKEMLKRSGPENYRDLEELWMCTKPKEIPDLYEKKIRQLEGKIAANQYLSGQKAENAPKIDLQELEKMFALGEITQEEFERKSESANPMP